MTEEILALCRAMGAAEEDETLLRPLIQAGTAALKNRLKTGVTPENCGEAFQLAAAMVAMDGLERATGSSWVASFSVGDVSIRTQEGKGGVGMIALAERLMAPWLGETGFAFRGVAG